MKTDKNIHPKEIFEKLDKNLTAIKKGLESGNFSKEEASEMKKEFQDLLLEGYKTKFGVRLHILSEESPNMPLKDVLVHMLSLLPSDINPTILPILTEYVFNNWKSESQKLAA